MLYGEGWAGAPGCCNELIIALAQSCGVPRRVPRVVCCGMRDGGGVGARALAVDGRLGLLDDGHDFGFPHVVDRLRHFSGGGGGNFVAEALVERFFGLQGGAPTDRGLVPNARTRRCVS